MGVNSAVVLSPIVAESTLAGCADLLAVMRFGVGYHSEVVAACTRADVRDRGVEPLE